MDATKSTEYSYYNNYELKSEKRNYTNTVAYTNLNYSYDEIGNRLKLDTYTRSNNTTQSNQFTYDALKALSSFNFLTVLKDKRGNIVQDQIHGAITTRTFNPLNKMVKSVFNGSTTTYTYNPHGHRTIKNGRFGKYHFIYDGTGKILAESLNGTITKEYIYLNNLLVSIRYNGATYAVHSDASGRPESITSSSGTVVWRARNHAFDREIEINSIGDMNIGYPGQYYDKETDTWYNIHRDYDAKAGRYIQSDPLGTVDGPNTYIYEGNDPVNKIDPSGKIAFKVVKQLIKNKGDVVQTVADVGGNIVTVISPSSTSLERIEAVISLVSPVDISDVKNAKKALEASGKKFGGRKGGVDTRAQNQAIRDKINDSGGNATGGFGEKESRFSDNGTNSTRYSDGTATDANGNSFEVQTTDTDAAGNMTQRELDAAADIAEHTNGLVVCVPKVNC